MALKYVNTRPAQDDAIPPFQVDLLQIVEKYPGPCLLIGQDGSPAGGNEAGFLFYDRLRAEPCWPDFSISLAEVHLRQAAVTLRTAVCDGAPLPAGDQPGQGERPEPARQVFDLTLVPVGPAGAQTLLFARDATFDQNLIAALTNSRSLYKDLVSCSSDFYWESDANGSFTFVGTRGALGYSARELNGMKAGLLSPTCLPDGMGTDGERAFDPALDPVWHGLLQSHTPKETDEVCLRHRNNEPNYFSVAVVPVFDRQGGWCGVRGAARDITQVKQKQAAVERANLRQRAISAVVQAMQSKLQPDEKMEEAANATLRSFEADLCLVYRMTGDGTLRDGPVQAMSAALYKNTAGLPPVPQERQITSHLRSCLNAQKTYFEFVVENWRFMAAVTALQDVNGVVCIGRPFSALPTGSHEPELLKEISHHVGITIAHVDQILKFQELSRQDPLTNLFNRRAFLEDAEKRLAHHRRHKRQAALVCIDFDDFKRINDDLGHKAGDAALIAFANVVSGRIRQGDLFARFGGDEFCLWLEEVTLDGAVAKVKQICEMRQQIRDAADIPYVFGFSMGIALFDPESDEDIDHLIARADHALLASKDHSKSGWSVADPTGFTGANKISGTQTC